MIMAFFVACRTWHVANYSTTNTDSQRFTSLFVAIENLVVIRKM